MCTWQLNHEYNQQDYHQIVLRLRPTITNPLSTTYSCIPSNNRYINQYNQSPTEHHSYYNHIIYNSKVLCWIICLSFIVGTFCRYLLCTVCVQSFADRFFYHIFKHLYLQRKLHHQSLNHPVGNNHDSDKRMILLSNQMKDDDIQYEYQLAIRTLKYYPSQLTQQLNRIDQQCQLLFPPNNILSKMSYTWKERQFHHHHHLSDHIVKHPHNQDPANLLLLLLTLSLQFLDKVRLISISTILVDSQIHHRNILSKKNNNLMHWYPI